MLCSCQNTNVTDINSYYMIIGMLQLWICLHRHLNELFGSELLLCLTLTAGALPAIPVMWFSQHVVDYCGHSNLLIIAFIFYIVRYTGNVYLVFFSHKW